MSESAHSVKISTKHRRTGDFIAQNSLLTDLFRISHINCVRNALIAAFILILSRQTITDFIHYGRLHWTFELLRLTVGKLHIVLVVWSLMTLSTSCVVYYSTSLWMTHRNFKDFSLKVYDTVWLLIYICYLACLLVIPCWQIVSHQLPIVSSAIILGEQLRQLMKTHSFVRENIRKILHQSADQSSSAELCHLKTYIYFLLAPTLLYRDSYPRTSIIRWTIVRTMFGQFLIVLVLVYHIISNFWMPIFRRFFVNERMTLEFAVTAIFDLMIPGVLMVILAFYGFFHCWLNAFAELLRFADRMFYEDWWNLTSAATFWRSWNVVVHDWLYVYVYKDLSELFNGNRKLATTFVVGLSAVFHEYFMIVSLGFFSPILIGWFGLFGMLLRFTFPRAKGAQWNIVLLTLLPICVSVIPYLYVLEASARYFPAKRITFWSIMFKSDTKQLKNSDL